MSEAKRIEVGFIGLGQMGVGMALNLAKSGMDLLVFDQNRDALAVVEEHGALPAASLEDIRGQCKCVFLCLPGETEVAELLFGPQGLLSETGSIQTIIDTSTLSFTRAREFSEQAAALGTYYADCPVSGLPKRAQDGSLNMMFGGSIEQFDSAKPYLELMGAQILYCGDTGAGQMTKAINNIIYNINIAGFCEVLPLAVKAGLDPEMLEQLVLGGSARSFASEHYVPRILDGKFDDDFPMALAYKDILNVQTMAESLQMDIPLVAAMTAIYSKALDAGFGEQPKSAMIKTYEKQYAVNVRRS